MRPNFFLDLMYFVNVAFFVGYFTFFLDMGKIRPWSQILDKSLK